MSIFSRFFGSKPAEPQPVSITKQAHEQIHEPTQAEQEEKRLQANAEAEKAAALLMLEKETKKRREEQEIEKKIENEEAVTNLITNTTLGNGMKNMEIVLNNIFNKKSSDDKDAWEQFIKNISKVTSRTKKPFSKILDVCADVYIKDQSRFENWGHTLYHLFPTDIRDDEYHDKESLLQSSENLFIVEKLVDEAVKRSVDNNTLGYVDSVIAGIIASNLSHLDHTQLDEEFRFKPMSLTQSKFFEICEREKSKDYPALLKFLQAKSPREFVKYLIEQNKPLSRNDLQDIAILQAMEKDFPPDQWKALMDKRYSVNGTGITLDELSSNVTEAEGATETVDGVYVDTDGTLIKDGILQWKILSTLEKYSATGKKIIIFSGGDPTKKTDQLRKLGVPEKFLPVLSKDGFKGKILERLIDDTKPEYQGLKTKDYTTPEFIEKYG